MAFCLCSGMTTFAQTHFGLRIGGAMPMGDFAEAKVTKANGLQKWALSSENGKYGGAAFGFNIGALLKFDIPSVEGLGIIASLDLIYNGINSDIEDYIVDIANDNNAVTTQPKYLNIPIMVGANYTFPLTEVIGIYGEAALGINLRKITNYTIVDVSRDEEIKTTYDLAKSFSYRIGAGFIFNNRFSIGVDYYVLGSEEVTGKTEYDLSAGNGEVKYSGKSLSTNMLLIRCGIMF